MNDESPRKGASESPGEGTTHRVTDYGGRLFNQHAKLLADSAISVEVATGRGYVSVDTKARLERIKVTPAGRRIPGLLVPLLRKDGSVWGYQYRPDSPRLNGANRAVKYETPSGQRAGLDVPPGSGPSLDGPNVPLLVTEGTRKADSAWSHGLACVALPAPKGRDSVRVWDRSRP
jgi:hypothetical protein